jgi:hypothetical protein
MAEIGLFFNKLPHDPKNGLPQASSLRIALVLTAGSVYAFQISDWIHIYGKLVLGAAIILFAVLMSVAHSAKHVVPLSVTSQDRMTKPSELSLSYHCHGRFA